MGSIVIDLGARRNEVFEHGMEAGKRKAALTHHERNVRCHHYRQRVHSRWLSLGLLAMLAIIVAFQLNAFPQLRDTFLVASGAIGTFISFHSYKWDWHRRYAK